MKKKSGNSTTPASRTLDGARAAWICLGISLLAVCAVRIRLLAAPLERDEGEYAYAGQLILEGVAPFVESYNMKMPGIYAAYAAVLAVFGQTASGIHLGLLFVNGACIVMLFVLTRRFFDPILAMIAAVTYGWLSLSSSALGVFAHATHFVVFFGLAAFLPILRASPPLRTLPVVGSGLLFGCAFMMKQHAAPFIVVGGCWLLWQLWRQPGRTIANRLGLAGAFGVAVFVPFLLTCLVIWRAGAFETFWFWTFEYAATYVRAGAWTRIASNLTLAILRLVSNFALVTGLILGGLVTLRHWKQQRLLIVALVLASCVAVSPGFYFREHYFVLMFPVLGILTALGAEGVSKRMPRRLATPTGILSPLIIAGIAWGQYIISDRAYLLNQSPIAVSRTLYSVNPFPESVEIANYLREHTQPDEQIAVFGSEPQIFFYAQRKSASGFVYVYSLMENQPFAPDMQQRMRDEVESAKPAYIVLVNIKTSWAVKNTSGIQFIDWAQRYTASNYERVGLIEISEIGARSFWDAQQRGRMPQSPHSVAVFKRKT